MSEEVKSIGIFERFSKLFLFYTIFYAFLAAFWITCLSLFLKNVDPKVPKYYGPGTIIGANPGVGYQPWLKENPESTLIKFDIKDPQSYKNYVDALDSYLDKYSNLNNTRVCVNSESNSDVIKDGKTFVEDAASCRFEVKMFAENGCNKSNSYGFADGKPCVILSLNRLIGWKPVDYEPDQIPEEIRGRYKKGSILFKCNGAASEDQERLGEIKYIPDNGIDGRFYPYAVMDNYHQPFVMVKFNSLPGNRNLMVECRAYAKNIEYDQKSRLGMVTFELLQEDRG